LRLTRFILLLFCVSSTLAVYGFGQQPYRSESVRFHDGSLEVEGPLTETDWKEINKRSVSSVHVLGSSDVSLFENPNSLKGLREVILMPSCDSAKSLRDLANNFPNIEELAVNQLGPLSEADLQAIHRLGHLFFLELCNDMPSCASFAAAVPPTLKRLLLEDTSITSAPSCRINLPALTYFSLRRSKLSKGFLSGLDAPELEEVSLSRVWAEPDAIKLFNRFPKLKRIFAYNMPQSSQLDLAQLQTLNPKIKVVVATTGD
jgi:hypothetical protein